MRKKRRSVLQKQKQNRKQVIWSESSAPWQMKPFPFLHSKFLQFRFKTAKLWLPSCQRSLLTERQTETWREGVCKVWVYRQISKTVLSFLGLAHKRLQDKRNFRRVVTIQTCGASFSLQLLIQSKLYPGYVILIGSSLSFWGSWRLPLFFMVGWSSGRLIWIIISFIRSQCANVGSALFNHTQMKGRLLLRKCRSRFFYSD